MCRQLILVERSQLGFAAVDTSGMNTKNTPPNPPSARKHSSPWSQLACYAPTIALALTGLSGCGQADSEFEPGVAVGIRAVLVDDAQVVSEEVEVGLLTDLEAVALRSEAAVVEPQEMQSRNSRVPTEAMSFEQRKRRLVEELSFSSKSSTRAAIEGGQSASLQPTTIRTLGNGMICWQSLFESAGSLVKAQSVSQVMYYTGDGIFAAVAEATSLKLPTTLGFISAGSAIGCVQSPDGDTVSVDFLESLLGIHFTYNMGFVGLGATVFYSSERGFARGFQALGSVEKASASFFPFLNFDLVLDVRGAFLVRPTQLIDNDPRTVVGTEFDLADNPFQQIATDNARLSSMPATGFRASMLREQASLISPTMSMLSETTGAGPAEDRPATTMADFFGHFLAQGHVDICRDCPNTSLDGIMAQMEGDIVASDGSGEATRDAVLGGFLTYRNSTPDAQRLALSQRQSASAVRFGTMALGDLAAEQRGDANRHVSEDIVELEGKVGESVTLKIDAQEIADLVGASASAIEGAQVELDASPRVAVSTFEVEGGAVEVQFDADDTADLLFIVNVDLSTAAGPFPDDVGDWTVRPALRRLRAAPGPVEHIFVLGAPNAAPGKPVQLQAMLADANGALITGERRIRFYDANDTVLGEALSADGIATIETTVLRASTPLLSDVRESLILVGGEEASGYTMTGDAISRESEIFVGGVLLEEAGGVSGYISSEEILLYFEGGLPPGRYEFAVRNPGGQESETVSLLVP